MQDQNQPSTEQTPQGTPASTPVAREVPGAQWSRLSWRFAIRFVIAALVGILAIWLIANLQTLLVELALAIVLVTGLSAVTQSLQDYGLPRPAAILLIGLLVLALVVILGVFVIPALIGQTATFVKQLPALAQGAESQLQQVQQRVPSLPLLLAGAAAVLVALTQSPQLALFARLSGIRSSPRSMGIRLLQR